MNELQQCMQMEVMGGGVTGFFFCVVIGTAIYKMFRSGAGRVSISLVAVAAGYSVAKLLRKRFSITR